MPLWLVSCQRRSDENIASALPILPLSFPPLAGLSYSAKAKNPFFSEEGGCGVTEPNSSAPLSIVPFPFLSRTKKASSEPAEVQEICSWIP
jgi:hypothetical protein